MRGRLGTFREHRQLTVHAIRIERDPNAEALHWLSVLSLKRSTYDVPCVLLTGTAGGMAPAHVHDREGGGGTKRLTDDDAAPAAKRRAMGRGHPSVTDDPVCATIMSWLSERTAADRISFAYEELKCDEGVVDAVRQGSEQADAHVAGMASSFVLARALRRLVEHGIVFVADAQSDRYEAVSHQHNLGPSLLRAIRERSADGDDGASGVSLDDLVADLGRTPLGNVSREQLAQSLELLVRSSRIYEMGPSLYRSVVL
eukprot:Opistho-2@21251